MSETTEQRKSRRALERAWNRQGRAQRTWWPIIRLAILVLLSIAAGWIISGTFASSSR